MHGLVSLLPPPHYAEVENLWQELSDQCGLHGIRVTPFPHFSWQIAEDYDWPALESTLAALAASRPFTVRTTGLGLFTGERPVIFIPVVKTAALVEFHARVWGAVSPVSRGASNYYAPDWWSPHISLAYQDVARANIGAVMERLAFRTYNWEFPVDNLSLIYEPTGSIGTLRYHFPLGG